MYNIVFYILYTKNEILYQLYMNHTSYNSIYYISIKYICKRTNRFENLNFFPPKDDQKSSGFKNYKFSFFRIIRKLFHAFPVLN